MSLAGSLRRNDRRATRPLPASRKSEVLPPPARPGLDDQLAFGQTARLPVSRPLPLITNR